MTALPVHQFVYNSIVSRLRAETLSGQFGGSPKHDHYSDFGWPSTVVFNDLKNMYERNGLAQAAVERYVSKVWETDPEIYEAEEAHEPTEAEDAFKAWAEDIRFWQKLAEADRRGMVGDYAGLIIQIADNLEWNQPLGRVRKGLEDVWDLIPVWEIELTPAEWDDNPRSRRYGQPVTYQYQEQRVRRVTGGPAPRSLTIHHSRVILWSSTGDLLGNSILRAGYNALLDHEKVVGGGAEGFWKNARQSMTLNVDPNSDLSKLARSLSVTEAELGTKINDLVDDWTKGFDKAFITQGIEPQAHNITMPQPAEFQEGPLQLFAASVQIPVRVLIGNVTGERATVEDEIAWSKRCNSLRSKQKRPLLKRVLNLLEECGAIDQRDWFIFWTDLTEGTTEQKLDTAMKMAEINAKSLGIGDLVPFSSNEVREAAGYDVESEDDGGDEREAEKPEPPPLALPDGTLVDPAADPGKQPVDPKAEGEPNPSA